MDNASIRFRPGGKDDHEKMLNTVAAAFACKETGTYKAAECAAKFRFFDEMIRKDPWFAKSSLLLLEDETKGLIASSLYIFRRGILPSKTMLKTGGIGVVATHPEYQGRGLASILLRHAEDIFKQEGTSFSTLQGSAGVYEKAGWKVMEGGSFGIDLRKLAPKRQAVKFNSLDMGQVIERAGMLAGYHHRSINAGVYPEEEWKALAGWLSSGKDRIMEAFFGEKRILIRVKLYDDAIQLQDIISEDGAPSDTEIWEALSYSLKEQGIGSLGSGHCALEYPLLKELQSLPSFRDCISVGENKGFRIKFHSRERMPEKLLASAYWHKDHL